MADDQKKSSSHFSGTRLLIYGLVTVLAILSLSMRGDGPREWEKCKESLVQQFFSDTCTPRSGFGPEIIIPPSQGQNT